MTAEKFLARLCALVPPTGFHMTRYFGVLASRHHLRPRRGHHSRALVTGLRRASRRNGRAQGA